MRLFTAIDIPMDLKEALRAFVSRLRPAAAIGWSPLENLHVTTKFIGDWPEPRLDEMKQTLASVPAAGAIDIAIKGVGWFPNTRRPRVFWSGVDGGEPLRNLARATDQTVAKIGVQPEEREYAPHLTLARIRENVALDTLHQALASFPAGCGFDFGCFRATQFCLFLSAGGKYTRLAGFPLERL